MKMRTILVKCTYIIPVEVPDDPDFNIYFDIEDNHCPGTGYVGAALEANIEKYDKVGSCWACALGGKNEIVEAETDP